jgi:hypothetical protein
MQVGRVGPGLVLAVSLAFSGPQDRILGKTGPATEIVLIRPFKLKAISKSKLNMEDIERIENSFAMQGDSYLHSNLQTQCRSLLDSKRLKIWSHSASMENESDRKTAPAPPKGNFEIVSLFHRKSNNWEINSKLYLKANEVLVTETITWPPDSFPDGILQDPNEKSLKPLAEQLTGFLHDALDNSSKRNVLLVFPLPLTGSGDKGLAEKYAFFSDELVDIIIDSSHNRIKKAITRSNADYVLKAELSAAESDSLGEFTISLNGKTESEPKVFVCKFSRKNQVALSRESELLAKQIAERMLKPK